MGKEKRVTRGCKLGIKTTITKADLPYFYQQFELKETKDGMSDSVYLLGQEYVLKIFENDIASSIENEKKLLEKLQNLAIPKIIEILTINEKPAIIYTQISGTSIKNPTLAHIKQIGNFLQKFHQCTHNIHSSNEILFSKENLKQLISKSNFKEIEKYFDTLHISFKNDGIIHGDLFPDNAKFEDDILSGVYDFSEACNGDFIFDIAVVALSWCFNVDTFSKKKTQLLLDSYGLKVDIDVFKEYIKYALVYYATTRFINQRDYKELIRKLDNI